MPTASKYRGVTFNGHHTSEFGLMETTDDAIGMPAKTKYQVTIPGSNTPIDLSNLYGPVYGERTYTKTFLFDPGVWTPEQKYSMWTQLVNWLMQPVGKVPLYDDVMPGYHYLGEVQAAPTFAENLGSFGSLQVTWQCYPFRIRDKADFDDTWDTFNFETDVAQDTLLDKNHTNIILVNIGVSNVPVTMHATEATTIGIGGTYYTLKDGDNIADTLALVPGENQVSLNGPGTVTISWHSEVI